MTFNMADIAEQENNNIIANPIPKSALVQYDENRISLSSFNIFCSYSNIKLLSYIIIKFLILLSRRILYETG